MNSNFEGITRKVSLTMMLSVSVVMLMMSLSLASGHECGGNGLMTGLTVTSGGTPVPLCSKPECIDGKYIDRIQTQMSNCTVHQGAEGCKFGHSLADMFPSDDGQEILILCCDFGFSALVLSEIEFKLAAGQTFLGDVLENNQKFGVVSNIIKTGSSRTAYKLTCTIIKCPDSNQIHDIATSFTSPLSPISPELSDAAINDIIRYQAINPLFGAHLSGAQIHRKSSVPKIPELQRSQPIYDYFDEGGLGRETLMKPQLMADPFFDPHPPRIAPIMTPGKSTSTVFVPSPACFSSDTIVKTKELGTIPMEQLTVGMHVLAHKDSVVIWDEVIAFLHREPNRVTEFLNVETASGSKLTVTPKHIVYAIECPVEHSEVDEFWTAMHVEQLIADKHCLFVITSTEEVDVSKIISIERVSKRGIYGPLTSNQELIADGVLVSCHSTLENISLMSTVVNIYTYFLSIYYFFIPESFTEIIDIPIVLQFLLSLADHLTIY